MSRTQSICLQTSLTTVLLYGMEFIKTQGAAPCAHFSPTHKRLFLPPPLPLSLSLPLIEGLSELPHSICLPPASLHPLSLFSSLPYTLVAFLHLPLCPQTNWGRWFLLFPLSKPLSAAVARHLNYIVSVCACVCMCVNVHVHLLLVILFFILNLNPPLLNVLASSVCVWVDEH